MLCAGVRPIPGTGDADPDACWIWAWGGTRRRVIRAAYRRVAARCIIGSSYTPITRTAAMRLRAVNPPLPPAIIEALDECGIKTDADLIFSGTPIEIYAKLAPCEFSLADLTRYIKQVTKAASAPATRGNDLFKLEQARYAEHGPGDCAAGVPELDAVLAKLAGHYLTEISADHGSCKSVSSCSPCSMEASLMGIN